MNVREIAARLNAKTVRYDTGRGGRPELTDQDIAAAIGLASAINATSTDADRVDPLAFKVWCLLWWPDGAEVEPVPIAELLRRDLYNEYSSRNRSLQLARLSLNIAEGEFEARDRRRTRSRAEREADEAQLARLRAAAAREHARQWPGTLRTYPVLLDAVLAEIVSPRRCSECSGRGNRQTDAGPRRCERCNGSGARPMTKSARAQRLGVTEGAYRASWEEMYESTFRRLSDLESAATAAIRKALGSDSDVLSPVQENS